MVLCEVADLETYHSGSADSGTTRSTLQTGSVEITQSASSTSPSRNSLGITLSRPRITPLTSPSSMITVSTGVPSMTWPPCSSTASWRSWKSPSQPWPGQKE